MQNYLITFCIQLQISIIHRIACNLQYAELIIRIRIVNIHSLFSFWTPNTEHVPNQCQIAISSIFPFVLEQSATMNWNDATWNDHVRIQDIRYTSSDVSIDSSPMIHTREHRVRSRNNELPISRKQKVRPFYRYLPGSCITRFSQTSGLVPFFFFSFSFLSSRPVSMYAPTREIYYRGRK